MASSSALRALSPPLQSIGAAIYASAAGQVSADDVAARVRNDRHLSIAASPDFFSLSANILPIEYRAPLTDKLRALERTHIKLHGVKKTLANLEEHKQKGTFPKSTPSTAPRIQLTSEFADSKTARDSRTANDAAHVVYSQALLANDIKLKKAEVAQLEQELSPANVWNVLQA
jgi:hypothetical protein